MGIMKRIIQFWGLILVVVMISACSTGENMIGTENSRDLTVTYKDVKPIFRESCALVGCHLDPGARHDLRLDTYDHILKGSGHGAVVVAGYPDEGEMTYRLSGEISPAMPLNKKLDPAQIELIRLWIIDGLKRD